MSKCRRILTIARRVGYLSKRKDGYRLTDRFCDKAIVAIFRKFRTLHNVNSLDLMSAAETLSAMKPCTIGLECDAHRSLLSLPSCRSNLIERAGNCQIVHNELSDRPNRI
ncbi:Hypothetical protein NTJ_11852 [Nesidiocoris tenuis]|uniref:Uncharacterized protein n=1 Tax=Nesidiocoris tenuis TaxID=355587 RepID=A0ABN7B3N7_9HEMI|nr:Hypothetical protein NTJ_11852 [Nesidiocoris tenuis]